ncbi:copper resistance CopC family protein [Spiribacter pallidus]|uniref:Copper resistance protein C n=1 Tax=Spiribacter pallidus TaxID=1987936 RepID=A0ABV3T9A5_9GAMM
MERYNGITAAAAALLLWAAIGGSSTAGAHSQTVQSEPPNGAVLGRAPDQVTVQFDAPMRVISVELTAARGETFDVSANAGRDPAEQLVVDLPALGPGDYSLSWRGLSEDGHSMAAEMEFRVDAD